MEKWRRAGVLETQAISRSNRFRGGAGAPVRFTLHETDEGNLALESKAALLFLAGPCSVRNRQVFQWFQCSRGSPQNCLQPA